MCSFAFNLLGGCRNIFGTLVLGCFLKEIEAIVPVDARNRNRLFDSFTDEECWHNLRFRKAELHQFFALCEFPAVVICNYGSSCSGEHAFCVMLYRIAYPSRLFELQEIFGRDYSQVSRMFKWSIDYMYEKHRHKVEGNLSWYSDRFDMYHQATIKKIIDSPRNHHRGFVPMEKSLG